MEKMDIIRAFDNLNLIFKVVKNEIDGELIKNYQLDEDLAQEMMLILLEIDRFNVSNKEEFIKIRLDQFMNNYGFIKVSEEVN